MQITTNYLEVNFTMNQYLEEEYFENRHEARSEFKKILNNSIANESNYSFIVSGVSFVGKSEFINIVLSELSSSIEQYKHKVLIIGSDSIYNDKSENKKFIESLNLAIQDKKGGLLKFIKGLLDAVKSFIYVLSRVTIYLKSVGGIDLDDILKYTNKELLMYKKITKYFRKNKVILVVQDASQIDDISFKLFNSLLKNKKNKLILIYEYKTSENSNFDSYYSFLSNLNKQTNLKPTQFKIEPLDLEHCINIYKRKSGIEKDKNITQDVLTKLNNTYNSYNGNLYRFIDFDFNICTTDTKTNNADLKSDIEFESDIFKPLSDQVKLIIYLIYLHQGKIQYSILEKMIIQKQDSKLIFYETSLVEKIIKKMLQDGIINNQNDQLSISKHSILNYLNKSISDDNDKLIKIIVFGMIKDYYTMELKDAYLFERSSGEFDKYSILLKLYTLFDLNSFTEVFDLFYEYYSKRTSFDQKRDILIKISSMNFIQLNKNIKIVHFAIEETFSMGMYYETLSILKNIYDESNFSHVIFRFMSEILLNQYNYYESIIEDIEKKYVNDKSKLYILNVIKYIYYLESDRKSLDNLRDKLIQTSQVNNIFYYFILRSCSIVDVSDDSINRLKQCVSFFELENNEIELGITHMALFGQYLLSGKMIEARDSLYQSILLMRDQNYSQYYILNNLSILDMIDEKHTAKTEQYLLYSRDLVQDSFSEMLINNNLLIYYTKVKNYENSQLCVERLCHFIENESSTNYMKVCLYFNILNNYEVFGIDSNRIHIELTKIKEKEILNKEQNETLELCNLILHSEPLSEFHQDRYLVQMGYIYTDLADWGYVLKFKYLS